ncbi:MAG TPA: cupin domain-containing protein [Burkholderiales bacterium]|nr:cupin domain-containing protein [Burkholderiales bacterium]
MAKAAKTKPRKPVARRAKIHNIAEVDWEDLAGHFGGAFSKFLVRPETTGSRQIDYRISCYQPRAYVETHAHKVQEQVYHVLEGEGLMEIGGRRQVVRRHDVIFIPPGVKHAIYNSGLVDLVFVVVTVPIEDR